MDSDIRSLREDLRRLIIDVALIKKALIKDGELSDWAVNELASSRRISNSECLSQEEVRRKIMSDEL